MEGHPWPVSRPSVPLGHVPMLINVSLTSPGHPPHRRPPSRPIHTRTSQTTRLAAPTNYVSPPNSNVILRPSASIPTAISASRPRVCLARRLLPSTSKTSTTKRTEASLRQILAALAEESPGHPSLRARVAAASIVSAAPPASTSDGRASPLALALARVRRGGHPRRRMRAVSSSARRSSVRHPEEARSRP